MRSGVLRYPCVCRGIKFNVIRRYLRYTFGNVEIGIMNEFRLYPMFSCGVVELITKKHTSAKKSLNRSKETFADVKHMINENK